MSTALGIFVGQVMTAALAGFLALAWSAYVDHELSKQRMSRPARTQRPVQPNPQPTTTPVTTLEPLRANQRCIKGQRFQRVEHGWVEVPNRPAGPANVQLQDAVASVCSAIAPEEVM
ncbi:chloride channel protein [Pseudoxanthomonas composti]|uniref:Chloride channel protein n=1 Tax=Pseudoxanthomonas composti TaxID=2137479 RepID=A0A4Q1JY61_9GAMM|nr:chloride channel protein [Pseudoxanthomonas composti]RXR07398.1 chloride channel protein [Pseudoxanthomonas composti]